MKRIAHIALVIGLMAAALFGVAADSAAESKSQKLSRLQDQLCTTHRGYLEGAAASGAALHRDLEVLADRLPGSDAAAAGRGLVARTALEVFDYLDALDLQLAVAGNACSSLAAGRQQAGLVWGYGETASKSDIIGGLRGELCGLYVDNLAEIVIRGDRILEGLARLQADSAAAAAARSARVDLPGAEAQLRQVVGAVADQFFAAERACRAIAEKASKREFLRAAEAGLRPALANPYLVLLLVYD